MMHDLMIRIKEIETTGGTGYEEELAELLSKKIRLENIKMLFAEKQGRVIL